MSSTQGFCVAVDYSCAFENIYSDSLGYLPILKTVQFNLIKQKPVSSAVLQLSGYKYK